jgi:uncharacterized protein (TIGR04206 family)
MWVRSEYAGELAVLSAWLCALLPWSVSYASPGDIQVFRLHFPYVLFQFVPGVGLGQGPVPFVLVVDGPAFGNDPGVILAYQLWTLAAAVFVLVLAWSVVYYVAEERLKARSPLDPVRVMGGLLVVAALPLSAATYYLVTALPALTVPVGVVFMYLFGGLLLVVDRA